MSESTIIIRTGPINIALHFLRCMERFFSEPLLLEQIIFKLPHRSYINKVLLKGIISGYLNVSSRGQHVIHLNDRYDLPF